MDLRKLKKLIDLVEESGICELEVSEGEEKVRIVKPGDLLCVLEAMHERHEIASEFAGTVSAILVDNGRAVEYGEPLFLID